MLWNNKEEKKKGKHISTWTGNHMDILELDSLHDIGIDACCIPMFGSSDMNRSLLGHTLKYNT